VMRVMNCLRDFCFLLLYLDLTTCRIHYHFSFLKTSKMGLRSQLKMFK
jgi:hypothetical protein